MQESNLKNQKLDIFFALQTLFQKEFGTVIPDLFDKFLTDSEKHYFELINSNYSSLSPEEKSLWEKSQFAVIKQRGRIRKLDKRINFEHLAEFIRIEPLPVKLFILKNISQEKANKIIDYLNINDQIRNFQKNPAYKPNTDLLKIIKKSFISTFAIYENIVSPTKFDEFDGVIIEKLVFNLGLREIAIACRGLGFIENLATVMRKFGDNNARLIAGLMKDFSDIPPHRTAFADNNIQDFFSADSIPDEIISIVGLKVLALILADEEQPRIDYTKLKLPYLWSKKFDDFLALEKENLLTIPEEEKDLRLRLKQDILADANRFLAEL